MFVIPSEQGHAIRRFVAACRGEGANRLDYPRRDDRCVPDRKG